MTTTRTVGAGEVRDAYRKVQDKSARAAEKSGRRPDDIALVAVTKTASPDQIRALVEMGHTDLAESQVQQLAQRAAVLDEFLSRKRALGGTTESSATPPVRWHMIGHLQRNKIKRTLPLVHLIHSIDSLRVAEEVHGQAARLDRVVDVLIQVNVANEASKHGVAVAAAMHMADQVDTLLHLRLRGLMVMAPQSGNPEDARPIFARAFELFNEIQTANTGWREFNLLSMGMSDDYEVAIEEGANVVRIGRALFGDG